MDWPVFAPIKLDFDQQRLRAEIVSSGILVHSHVSTTTLVGGRPRWDDGVHFKSERFKDHSKVPYWQSNGPNKKLTEAQLGTFLQVNATYCEAAGAAQNYPEMWQEAPYTNGVRYPLWLIYDQPWQFRTDFSLPYLQEIVVGLGLEYVSTIRILTQTPPSIGLVHKDSGPNTNLDYYSKGGVSITLNVASGGAHLYFLNSKNEECFIDEAHHKAWHFNDGFLHCTDSTSSLRMQIRIYGRHRNYLAEMDRVRAIW